MKSAPEAWLFAGHASSASNGWISGDDPVAQCRGSRAGVAPTVIIKRLTGLIDEANIVPMPPRLALTRRVILWCVEEYFGHLGGNVLSVNVSVDQATSGALA